MSVSPFSSAHRLYVKSLYKRYLKNSLDWCIDRPTWRQEAQQIRAEFEANRNVHDPRALAVILEKAEASLAARVHPDPYIPASFPGGTKWERNIPPKMGPIYDHEAHLLIRLCILHFSNITAWKAILIHRLIDPMSRHATYCPDGTFSENVILKDLRFRQEK
ncbi:hypothetical protein BDQ17DRAFT_298493 [Cyathus striatus]|nr:hypothetical protein BDQ17DRAFT_298493 [Cyathus striatus]